MDVIPIHSNIDSILSNYGGLVRGFMYEFFGPDADGKTTLAILIMCAAQRIGLKVGYIEAEYLDEEHAKFFGLDIDSIDKVEPETAEEGLSEIIRMCDEGHGLIIVDSVVGLVPEAQLEGEVGDTGKWAQLASLLSRELPRINKKAKRNKTAIIFINQIRANIQKFGMGPTTTPPAGYALKHYTSARFEVRRVAWIKYADKTIGFKMRLRAPKKNRFATPNRDGYLDIICDHEAPAGDELNKRRKNKIDNITFKE